MGNSPVSVVVCLVTPVLLFLFQSPLSSSGFCLEVVEQWSFMEIRIMFHVTGVFVCGLLIGRKVIRQCTHITNTSK